MKAVSVEERIAADPTSVYELVSDVTRMGEWSPETTSCRWVGGARSAAVGSRFKGANRHGWHRWSTTCQVIAADPGRRFAFDVNLAGIPIARWEYEIDSDDGGCRVTERWTDRRPAWLEKVSPLATGVGDREHHNRATMTETLSRLRRAAESG